MKLYSQTLGSASFGRLRRAGARVRALAARIRYWWEETPWAWISTIVVPGGLVFVWVTASGIAGWVVLRSGQPVSSHSLFFPLVNPSSLYIKAGTMAFVLVISVWDPGDWMTTARRSGLLFLGAAVLMLGLFASADFEASRQAPSGAYQCFVENGAGTPGALTVRDAIYFTMGTLTTAGTGNIQPISQFCREMVAWQTGIGALVVLLGVGGVLWRIMQRPDALPTGPERFESALARAYHRQADRARDSQRTEEAELLYRQSLAMLEALTSIEPSSVIYPQNQLLIYSNLVYLHLNDAEASEAERITREAIRIAERLVTSRTSDKVSQRRLLSWRVQLGDIVKPTDYREAAAAYRAALDLAEMLAQEGSADIDDRRNLALCLDRMSDVTLRMEKYTDAQQLARRALETDKAVVKATPADVTPNDRRSLGVGYMRMGEIAAQRGKLKGAVRYYRAALKVWEAALPPDAPEIALMRARLAELVKPSD